ncbi:saccharopine dehydrogenase family protein [Lujinxingia litoralis]|nr:saccharopine dehydrogenase NADP-binding domain-containing protein [Lujinxingia litoralis]
MGEGREFDVIVFGATGFTGRLVARYLARHARAGSWAIAGRSEEKLMELRADLAGESLEAGGLSMIQADVSDGGSLRALARRARVVCSTVGPYALYGEPVVEACIEEGADYCDLTGEMDWVAEMIERHHEAARHKGVRVVHSCGFDSVPSDLGVLLMQQEAIARWGRPAGQGKYYLWQARGGFSGGTIASAAETVERAAGDARVRARLSDPYALYPSGELPGPDGQPQDLVKYDREIGAWTGPFMMARVNEKVVRRSNALRGFEYGREFTYGEVVRMGPGVGGALGGWAMTLGLGGMVAGLAFRPGRWLLKRFVLPKPGEGPSEQVRKRGCFRTRVYGWKEVGLRGGERVEVEIGADQDPGYGATSLMLAESAMLLAEGREAVSGGLPRGGVLTPASALGETLIERLRSAGMIFRVL